MPCRHANSGSGSKSAAARGLVRREFMKSALAIGGASALSTTASLYGLSETAVAEGDPITIPERNNRQHAWADFITPDVPALAPPRHHLLLLLDVLKDGKPTGQDRREVEGALRQLEEAFVWNNRGLLFTIGYAPVYFERFDDPLASGVDLRDNQTLIDAMKVGDENPTPESFDAVMHLASDNALHLLLAEESLWGFPGLDEEGLNPPFDDLIGFFEHDFTGIFEKPTTFPARRTGFVGAGLPKQEVAEDVSEETAENIPEEAPLSMGFKSGFEDNIPAEDDITIAETQTLDGQFEEPGVFAQGTIEQVSKIDLDLDSWYDQSKDERTERMFSPHHVGEVGEVGEELGETSGPGDLEMRDHLADDDVARRTQEDAEKRGIVGHQQKLARARFDLSLREEGGVSDGTLDTTILRRDFDTTDQARPGLHFVALMRFVGYMVYTRKAMNGVAFNADEVIPPEPGEEPGTRIRHDDVDIDLEDDGFLNFATATRRGNFVVPPLEIRALPPAQAIQPVMEIKHRVIDPKSEDLLPVVIRNTTGFDPKELDMETVRFGDPSVVNRGGGARPAHGSTPVNGRRIEDADLLLRFPIQDTGFDEGSNQARLFGKATDLHPVFGTTDVNVKG